MKSESSARGGAGRVAAGIFLSRFFGLLRERAVAHFFGVGALADVFSTAFRVPNLLQNLLGEGTISAAFIPVYSRLIDQGREEEAGRFAGAIFGLLLCTVSLITLLGVVFAREIVSVTAYGYLADAARVTAGEQLVDRFPLAVAAVRIIFPMTALLVLSAWALGVLNSHRRFFLAYVAPVLWNSAIIAALVLAALGFYDFGAEGLEHRLFFAACYGALAGGLLQFLVQVPLVLRLAKGLRLGLSTRIAGVREALRAVGPVIAGRGAYQISSLLDGFLATLIAVGAVGAVRWAATLYLLPVSLFGMSVAAAELPELSRQRDGASRAAFVARLRRSLRQMSFLIVPTVIGYLCFGFLVVGALYRSRGGDFSLAHNWLVFLVLCGYTLGLVATTWTRLVQNAFFALSDTRTPARIAIVRVSISAFAALGLMFALDRTSLASFVAVEGAGTLRLGALGLSLAASLGAWVELFALRFALRSRLPEFTFPVVAATRMIGLASLAAVPAMLVWSALPAMHVLLSAGIVLSIYAGGYLGLSRWTGAAELASWLARWR